jgi:hypothetical protein
MSPSTDWRAIHGRLALLHAPVANVDDARAERPCLDKLQVDPVFQGREIRVSSRFVGEVAA